MLDQSFHREGQESFYTVDVDLSIGEFISMVYIEMAVSAEHKRVVSAPFVVIDDRTPSDLPHSLMHQRRGRSISDNAHRYLTLPVQDTKHDDLIF